MRKKTPTGADSRGASEETLTLAPKVRELANKKRSAETETHGASEETLTLDLFLGKEAL